MNGEKSVLRGNDWMTDDDARAILRFGAPKRDLYEAMMNQRTICGAPVEYKGHWIECEMEPGHDTERPDDPHRFVTSHFARHVDRCKGDCIPPWAHNDD